jgi:hypothetical protein
MKRPAESMHVSQTRTPQTTRREFLSLVGTATTLATLAPTAFAAGRDKDERGRGNPEALQRWFPRRRASRPYRVAVTPVRNAGGVVGAFPLHSTQSVACGHSRIDHWGSVR